MSGEVDQHLGFPSIRRFKAQWTDHALPSWAQFMIQFKVITPKLTIRKRLGAERTIGVEAGIGLKVEIKMFSIIVRSSNYTSDTIGLTRRHRIYPK
jgi:hypothetical protein